MTCTKPTSAEIMVIDDDFKKNNNTINIALTDTELLMLVSCH